VFTAHYFEHLTDTLRSLYSADINVESLEEAHTAAAVLLPTIPGALGFRLCDKTDRQLDIYVPVDAIAPGS
jgi:hypothetical protein